MLEPPGRLLVRRVQVLPRPPTTRGEQQAQEALHLSLVSGRRCHRHRHHRRHHHHHDCHHPRQYHHILQVCGHEGCKRLQEERRREGGCGEARRGGCGEGEGACQGVGGGAGEV